MNKRICENAATEPQTSTVGPSENVEFRNIAVLTLHRFQNRGNYNKHIIVSGGLREGRGNNGECGHKAQGGGECIDHIQLVNGCSIGSYGTLIYRS